MTGLGGQENGVGFVLPFFFPVHVLACHLKRNIYAFKKPGRL